MRKYPSYYGEKLYVFMQSIDKRNYDGCWPWKGDKDDDGYGVFNMKKAHEISWTLFGGGLIPTGTTIIQKCNNKLCVNPRHLKPNPSALKSMRMKPGRNEARRIVEEVLGKPLPYSADVHHVDGVESNNEHSNLVACEDRAYHMLIQRRTDALRACGHADWRRCSYCQEYDDPANMLIDRRNAACHRKCRTFHHRSRYWMKRGFIILT